MDLIYTNANKIDQGVLHSFSLDLSFGEDEKENNFELTLSKAETEIEDNSIIYIDGTEYGGIVDGVRSNTESETITRFGRTWHGLLNSKIIEPDVGENYFVVSGEANTVISSLIDRLGLSKLFSAIEIDSGVNISRYQFNRYCKGYDGIRKMLAANGAKLKIRWENRLVILSAVPIADYTSEPVDGDIAPLSVERHGNKVNHLICLGRGELSEREIIHLYVDQFERIVNTQVYTGLDEVTEIYDYSNAESLNDLTDGGIERLKELRGNDKIEVSISENAETVFDICDIISAIDNKTGNTVDATITQKIVKINNGVVTIEYKTDSKQTTNASSYCTIAK